MFEFRRKKVKGIRRFLTTVFLSSCLSLPESSNIVQAVFGLSRTAVLLLSSLSV
jgi:hypothetical protein